MPRPKKPIPPQPGDRAIELARYLFTNGAGDVAERLVLRSRGKPDMGGWSRQAVVSAIRRFFPDATKVAREEEE